MPGKRSDFEPHIKVTFRQSGGFGGLVLGSNLDTETLSPREAAQLRSLVRSSGVVSGSIGDAKRSMSSPDARDLTTYEIEVTFDEGMVRLAFDDMSMPPDIEPLLEFVRARARARPLR